MNLTSQEAQVACFRNVAGHLASGGKFLIEVMMSDLRRLPLGQNAIPRQLGPDRWDGWTREPLGNESRQHISVWEKPAN